MVGEYLRTKGVQFKRVSRPSGEQAVYPCPACGDKDFAVNLANGLYQCFSKSKCGISGTFWSLQSQVYGDKPRPLKARRDDVTATKKTYSKPKIHSEKPNAKLVEFFTSRGILPETVKIFKIGQKGDEILFPYFKNGELVNVKHRGLVEKRFTNEKDCEHVLFNRDSVVGKESIIICEGEIDCMSLTQMGFDNVVSVPDGASSLGWIADDYDMLEGFSTVYLMMDADSAGQNGAREIARRLGFGRCMNVVLPYKDANECLKHGMSMAQFVELVGHAEPFDIEFAGHVSDIVVNELTSVAPDAKTPWSQLNDLVGGWRLGELSIFIGQPRSGKTIMMNEIALSLMEQGKRVFILSLELTPNRLVRWIGERVYDSKEYTPGQSDSLKKDVLKNLIINKESRQTDGDQVLSMVQNVVSRYDVEYVFIDCFFRIKFATDNFFMAQSSFVQRLHDLTKEYGLHTFLLAHSRKLENDWDIPGLYDIAGSGDISGVADNVYIVERVHPKVKGEYDKETGKIPETRLWIKKDREEGHFEKSIAFGYVGRHHLVEIPEPYVAVKADKRRRG